MLAEPLKDFAILDDTKRCFHLGFAQDLADNGSLLFYKANAGIKSILPFIGTLGPDNDNFSCDDSKGVHSAFLVRLNIDLFICGVPRQCKIFTKSGILIW